jgi:hypothetical protein
MDQIQSSIDKWRVIQVQYGESPTFAFVAVALEPRRAPAPGQRGLLHSHRRA